MRRAGPTRKARPAAAMLATTLLIVSACTGDEASPASAPEHAGGTLRVGVLLEGGAGGCAFVLCGGQTNDPQIEGIGFMSYEIERCCLLRTLLS